MLIWYWYDFVCVYVSLQFCVSLTNYRFYFAQIIRKQKMIYKNTTWNTSQQLLNLRLTIILSLWFKLNVECMSIPPYRILLSEKNMFNLENWFPIRNVNFSQQQKIIRFNSVMLCMQSKCKWNVGTVQVSKFNYFGAGKIYKLLSVIT